jgi:hypothetical protein
VPHEAIGEILSRAGVLSTQDPASSLAPASLQSGPLSLRHGLLPVRMAEVLASELGMPLVRPSLLQPAPTLVSLLPEETARRLHVLPVYMTEGRGRAALWLAMEDPTDQSAIDECAATARVRIRPMVAPGDELRASYHRWYGGPAPMPAKPPPPPQAPPRESVVELDDAELEDAERSSLPPASSSSDTGSAAAAQAAPTAAAAPPNAAAAPPDAAESPPAAAAPPAPAAAPPATAANPPTAAEAPPAPAPGTGGAPSLMPPSAVPATQRDAPAESAPLSVASLSAGHGTPAILVVQAPAAFVSACREAFPGDPVEIRLVDLREASRVARDVHPFAIVVPDEVYQFDPEGFSTLALGARALLVTALDEHATHLRPLLWTARRRLFPQ